VLDAQGRIVDASAQLPNRPLLTSEELRRAQEGTITVVRDGLIEADARVRLLATPAQAGGRQLVVVVGAAIDDNDDALRNLGLLLLAGGGVGLLLASAAGYGVAAGALRPVDAMRRKAGVIRDDRPGERLPVPAARDEIGQLAETLNEMLARLEHALERERSFVSDASHELRTPLAILKAEVELALRAGRSEEELRAALRSAAEETDRLSQLADDLLVLARSDRGRLPLRIEPIEAREILDSVSERFARRARDAGRELVAEAPADLRLAADRLRLEQALSNMVENALRHGAGRIRLSAGERGENVELHVEDEGSGFPGDFADEAFERFTRAHQGRTGGGTGLGLAIVRAIATAHGGHASARNRPGRGADVWMELPRAATGSPRELVKTL
jgi:two-component system, OmpR family, sensor kinase